MDAVGSMRMSMRFVLFVYFAFTPSFSLYEDQAGSFDWRQSYLGKVKFAFFDASTHSSKKLFVATEANVLAALNSRTGNILWRHVLEEQEGNIDSLLHRGNILISVSGSGKYLRSWDTSTGSLLWEVYSRNAFELEESKRSEVFLGWNGIESVIAETNGDASMLISLAGNTVKAISLQDGSESWMQGAPDDQTISYHSVQYLNGFLYIIGTQDGVNAVRIRKLDAKNGRLVSERTVLASWLLEKGASCTFVKRQNLVCIESFSNSIQIISLSDESPTKSISLSSLAVDEATLKAPKLEMLGASTNSWDTRSEFLLKTSPGHQIVLNLAEDLSLTAIKEYSNNSLVFSSVLANKAFLVSLTATEGTLVLNCFDLDSRRELQELAQTVKLPEHQGDPVKATMYVFTKKDSEIGYRVFLATTDHAVSLIQLPGRIAWTREEALASITAVDIVELPFSPSQANFETLQEEFGGQPDDDVLSMFIRRIRAQAKQFQVLVNQFQAFVNAQQEHGLFAETPTAEEESLTRDRFNLRKLILIVTESGKLFGLDSLGGGIMWKYFLPDLAPYSNNGKLYNLLYAQRTVAHFPLTAQSVLLGHSRSTDGTLSYVFDPITGKPIGTNDLRGTLLPYKVLQALVLPHVDSKHTRLLVLLDSTLAAHVFPPTSEAFETIAKKANSIFFFLAGKDHAHLKGFVLQLNARKDAHHATEVWNVNIPPGHWVTTIAAKSPFEPVHSQGKVLGDRRVLYKYLNPNLIAVGTESYGDKPSISVLLIDAVTGVIVYHNRHKNAKGPLHLVHSEHWVVYTLYNTKSRRHEISVLEIYEGYNRRNSTAFSSLDPPPHPMVLHQAYVFTTAVRTLSVTTTELGITHKNLLFGLQSGYIYSLPKNYLDPRRTFTPTPQDREEGLMEYSPEIYTNPIAFINYNQTVANIHNIYTSGSGLESTCLVFTYGLDLYWTRVTPSRMFDVLKEDFDYWFIVGTLAVLVLVTVVSQRLASIKMLRQAWL